MLAFVPEPPDLNDCIIRYHIAWEVKHLVPEHCSLVVAEECDDVINRVSARLSVCALPGVDGTKRTASWHTAAPQSCRVVPAYLFAISWVLAVNFAWSWWTSKCVARISASEFQHSLVAWTNIVQCQRGSDNCNIACCGCAIERRTFWRNIPELHYVFKGGSDRGVLSDAIYFCR